MSESFTEVMGNALPWLLLLIPLFFWGKSNYDALRSHETQPDSFVRLIRWLKEDNFGALYLAALGWLMDKVSDIIGDRHRLNQIYITASSPKSFVQRTFGFNPFTPESYGKCLRLAFLYPTLSLLIIWAVGSSWGEQQKSLLSEPWQRWLLLGAVILIAWVELLLVRRWKGWRRWLVLNVPFLLVGVAVSLDALFLFEGDTIINSVIFNKNEIMGGMLIAGWLEGWLYFIFLFTLLYSGGTFAGWLIYRSFKKSHQIIHDAAIIVAVGVAVISALSIGSNYLHTSVNSPEFISIDIMAAVFAFAFVFTFAGIGNFAFAFAAASAIAFAIVVTLFSIGWIGVFIAIFAAGAAMVFLSILHEWAIRENKLTMFWLIYSLMFFIISYAILSWFSDENNEFQYSGTLFLWLLPLANAFLDWLSLGTTRGLLQAVRVGQHSGWVALAWAFADLILALVFLFLITTVLVGMMALGDALTGKTLVSLGLILQDMRCEPSSLDHWWIYFMLLTTLIPTLIHFALAGGAVTLWLPRPVRLWLADGLARDHHKIWLTWLYVTFMPIIGFILVPGILMLGLWSLITMTVIDSDTRPLNIFLDWADMLSGREAERCPVSGMGR